LLVFLLASGVSKKTATHQPESKSEQPLPEPSLPDQPPRVQSLPELSQQLPDFNISTSEVKSEKVSESTSENQSKQAFFDYLRPLIRQQNMKFRYDLAFLESIQRDANEAPHHNRSIAKKVKRLAKVYDVAQDNMEAMLEQLTVKIGQVPESLLLAQAAIDSDWASLDSVRKTNNLFGEKCFVKGCGFIPKNRKAHENYELKVFNTPQAAIVSHMKRLNSDLAYTEFRNIRQRLTVNNQLAKASQLAPGLAKHSVLGELYVDKLIEFIQNYKLE
jgi:Bax protein